MYVAFGIILPYVLSGFINNVTRRLTVFKANSVEYQSSTGKIKLNPETP
jgi:hypothetical protein